jgi:hypothetical protein
MTFQLYNLIYKNQKKSWGRIRILLKREGADQRTMANFYKTIIQSTLLYAAETWHLQQNAIAPIEVFHNYVIRHLSNRNIRKMPNSEIWIYPNMAMAYKDLSMLSIPEYIHKRKINLAFKVHDRPIYLHARNLELNGPGTRSFWGSEILV